VIPQRVKNATYEYALELLRAGSTDLASFDESQNIKRKRVDVLETEYVDPQDRLTGAARYPRVQLELEPLLETTSSTGNLEIMRV
jgi:hypothetical protein